MPARLIVSKAACIFGLLFAAACAMGGTVQSDSNVVSDGRVYHDAHVTTDAHVTPHDASVDAFVPKDAPSNGFCSNNNDCGGGTCCFVALCVPGTPIGTSLCIPQ